jgi:hypothetical protein
MSNFKPETGYIIVDVGFSGSKVATTSKSITKEDVDILKVHPDVRAPLSAALQKEISARNVNLNIKCNEPTFIIFKTLTKNWTFDPVNPIEIVGGLPTSDGEFELIPVEGDNSVFIIYDDFSCYGTWKYALNIDVTQGTGTNKTVTRIIIDPIIDNGSGD